MSLGGHAIGLGGASPADALRKVVLFLLFVRAGSGFEPWHDTENLACLEGFEPPAAAAEP